jgi:hypothetical protein
MYNESNEWYGTERAKSVTQKNRKKAGGKDREGCKNKEVYGCNILMEV